MAVKTIFSNEDFKIILSKYDIGELLSFTPTSLGTVQTNYILETTNGKFVFRYYENRSEKSVLFEADVLKYLSKNNFSCPNIKLTTHEESILIYNDKPSILYEFIEGHHVEYPNKNNIKDLLQITAKLHKLTENHNPLFSECRDNYTIEFCEQKVESIANELSNIDSSKKLQWYKDQLNKLNLPSNLPKGVCHGDLNFSNILYKDNQINSLIDFDDSNFTYLLFDLTTMVEPFKDTFRWDTWMDFNKNDDILDFTKLKDYVHVYMKYRPLHEIEKYHLFDIFKLSILIDCLWYFSRGKASDFFEKRKIYALDRLGRDAFYKKLFNKC